MSVAGGVRRGGFGLSLGVPVGVRRELVAALLGAEEVGAAGVLDPERLRTVHLHPADRVGRAAARGQPEEGGEDRHAEQVEDQLVVELDRAEDVRARRMGVRDQADEAEEAVDDSAEITMVTNISAVIRSAYSRP